MISTIIRFVMLVFLLTAGFLVYILATAGAAAFFQALGIVFALFVLALVVGLFIVRWLARKIAGKLQDVLGELTAGDTPHRIKLIAQPEMTWDDAAAVKQRAHELEELGFKKIGAYLVKPLLNTKLQAYCHPRESVYAGVYEVKGVGVWLDLCAHVKAGAAEHRLTYTNSANPQMGLLDRPPGSITVKAPELDTAALFGRLLVEMPSGERQPVSAEQFVAYFEKAWADEMEWRNLRGAPTDEEVRRVAAAGGQEVTDEMLAATRENLREKALKGLEQALLDRHFEAAAVPENSRDELRQRRVAIHDRMTAQDVAVKAGWLRFLAGGDSADAPELPSGTPRQAFASYNDGLPPAHRARLRGTVSSPVEADIYEAAEQTN